ncbi:plasma kallikrein [Nephila pilipes]|uniref:Vitamin K-dependent protein C n=1 Tax=Nephila pilipes TaxID=299642 RepID=A0A8X6U3L3_NEPPI|nr:plasma kallikrein [Nephila pilipes]
MYEATYVGAKRMLLLAIIIAAEVVQGEGNFSMHNCGISKSSVSGSKIVGGRNALDGEFPWQLSLQMRVMPVVTNYQHICGASIINSVWAVTAAHCIAGGFFTTYRVQAGAMNITKRMTPTTHMVYNLFWEILLLGIIFKNVDETVFIFNRLCQLFMRVTNPLKSLKNDIALLRLTTPIDIENSDGFINGVCLPSKDIADNITGTGTVTGWGTTSQGGSLSETLKAVDVPILSDEKCKEVYKENYESTMLCAGYEGGGKDSCQGDSGGPFVQRSSNGISTLIGIVSWGYGCAQPNYPGVYTETAHYIDWIFRTMKTLGGGLPPQLI